jgi:hypothetical protein
LLTAIGLPPGGSSTVHIYTKPIHRTTQNKQYIEQHKKYIEQQKNQYIEQHKNQYIEQHKKQYIEQYKKRYIEQHKKSIHRTTQKCNWNSAGRAPSLRVIPWHLPDN